MADVSRLRAILLSAFGARAPADGEQELFEQLMAHKRDLLNVFDVGPRNSQERHELESGRIVVNGAPLAVNTDFVRQVNFISQQLDCSERYIAGLLQDVVQRSPNTRQEEIIEATILEFHLRRRQIADCLRYLFDIIEGADSPDAPPLARESHDFVRQQLLPPPGERTPADSLPRKLLATFQNMDSVMAKAQAARQNAKSHTTLPGNQGPEGQLGHDILAARYDSLKYERRTLAVVLFRIARMGCLSSFEISRLVDWLHDNTHHSMTLYVLSAVLAAFDIVSPDSAGGQSRRLLALDKELMSHMKQKLQPSYEWREPGLKAVILLKWTLFLTEMRHQDPALEDREGFKADELEAQIWNAVQGDGFIYLSRIVAALYDPLDVGSTYVTSSIPPLEQEVRAELVKDEFKSVVLETIESLIRSLITHASSELRKIKQRQEDLLLAGTRGDKSRTFRASSQQQSRLPSGPGPDSEKAVAPRNDMATLFQLIGDLYSALPPERSLQFWGSGPSEAQRASYSEQVESTTGRLPSFLQWAVWSTQARDVEMLTALYNMLAGLAKGQQCSELAYNFLARGGGDTVASGSLPSSHLASGAPVSWGAIFGILELWASTGSTPRTHQPPPPSGPSQFGRDVAPSWQQQRPQQAAPPQQLTLTQQEVLLAQSFLRLLSTVVTWSVAVRITISGHARFRAIPTLVSLLPLGIPLELKGALFDTLAAFCTPGAGFAGVEICRSVWTLMERLEVINVRAGSSGGASMPVKGVEVELEEVESTYKMYPATIPFLKLLSTLIHTPKLISLRGQIADAEPINTILESLGQPYRAPGIIPYISFVVDNVFSRIASREYLRPSDRWRTNDLCLCFVERCLASYDLESLVSSGGTIQLPVESILQLAVHPGYDIMKRMLTQSTLQTNVLSYVVDGLDGLDRGIVDEEPLFHRTIVRALRIVLRVLELQNIFLDVLIPLLSEIPEASSICELHSVSYFIRFDQALFFTEEHIPTIVAYVAYPTHPEHRLLAVKILSSLATLTTASQLAIMVERSRDSERILDGFRSIVDAEVFVDVDTAEAVAERSTGAGAPDLVEPSDALEQAIRLAVLDLFIHNTHSSRPYPNIAHFLLFGGTQVNQIQDPHALGARRTSVHALFDLLNTGVPRGAGKDRGRRTQLPSAEPLMSAESALAERCYHVVYQVCQHPRTSDFSMRYLRSRENFFARHLAVMPYIAPMHAQDPFIEVIYSDGSRTTTTAPAFCAFLKSRSWILDLVALELHVLTSKGHHKSVSDLLEILFAIDEEPAGRASEDEVFRPFHEVGQSHVRMIEYFHSLEFDWSDSLTVQPVELQFLNQLNLQECLRTEESGCEIVDKSALVSALTAEKRRLHAQGRIVTHAHLQQLAAETFYILQSCAIENHRRRIHHAVARGYEAWRRVLDVVMAKCFDRIRNGGRETLLLDLLHAVPQALCSDSLSEGTAQTLAEAVVSVVTKLREHRRRQVLLQAAGNDVPTTLPAERLYTILRSLLSCVLAKNYGEVVRGNLYVALVNILHLVMPQDTRSVLRVGMSDSSLASTLQSQYDAFASDGTRSIIQQSQIQLSSAPDLSLVSNSLDILKAVVERLVAVVARDAIDGTEVWKTVAFMLLDSLVRLSLLGKQPNTVLPALSRPGFLNGFVLGLKEADAQLQAVLKPEPDDLNALYVYEAKMSLLCRMSQSRHGAERLLESRIIPILADCEYLDARPDVDQVFFDRGSFLPSAILRYHQLFIPAAQAIDGMLVTLGRDHVTAAKQALEFLKSHQDTVILLLRNETGQWSLPVLKELRVLVSLCANVLPLVPKTELLSNTGMGSIHAAVLSLSARCLADENWLDDVQPVTDGEMLANSMSAPGHDRSKFRAEAHAQIRILRNTILAYLGAASDFTETQLTPVLAPVVTTPPHEDRSQRSFAAIPTIGDAIEALNQLCSAFAETLKQVSDLSSELDSQGHLQVEHYRQMVPLPNGVTFDDFDASQKQSLIGRELQLWRDSAETEGDTISHSLEMLLLLLWRHLVFYTSSEQMGDQNYKSSVSRAMRLAPSSIDDLRSEVVRKLSPALEQLSALLPKLGHRQRFARLYLEAVINRLQATIQPQDTPSDSS